MATKIADVYFKNPERVQAFQMTKDRIASQYEWPGWLLHARNHSERKDGCVFEADPGSGPRLRLICNGQHWPILRDAWLVRRESGFIALLTPGDFEAMYTAINVHAAAPTGHTKPIDPPDPESPPPRNTPVKEGREADARRGVACVSTDAG